MTVIFFGCCKGNLFWYLKWMKSIFKFSIIGLVVLMIGGMFLYVYLLSLPSELPEIDGAGKIRSGKIEKTSLGDKLQLAVNSKRSITFTEKELNHYLAEKVKLKQLGKVSEYAKVSGLWVQLEEEKITFFLERKIKVERGNDEQGNKIEPYEQNHVVSHTYVVKSSKDANGAIEFKYADRGGKIGRVPAPGLFGMVTQAAFKPLGEIFSKEVELFKGMVHVYVKENEISLHPTRD